ncbi:MAG: PilZ domain-containing protein [Desulfobacteraceae bacterium]|nr:MAG: PilZ domain-containing protein [Desulfobacteraceae bacterium]
MDAERRQAVRRPIEGLPVAVSQRKANRLSAEWIFGEIREVSSSGVRIRFAAVPAVQLGVRVELLCFPPPISGFEERQNMPCRMHGRIVWCDPSRCEIGIALKS